MKKIISVIIPITKDFFPLTSLHLSSVLNQTFKDFEVIIVGNFLFLNEYKKKFSNSGENIKFVKTYKLDTASFINKGLEISEGKYICFLYPNDFFLQYKLQVQIECFEKNLLCDICYSDAYVMTKEGRVFGYWKAKNNLLEDAHCSIPISSLMIKRECFDKIGNFCQKMKHSEYAWLKKAKNNKMNFKKVEIATLKVSGISTNFYFLSRAKIIKKVIEDNFNFGENLLRKGEYFLALKYYEEVGELIPEIFFCENLPVYHKIYESYYKRALCHYHLGEYQKAITFSNVVITYFPHFWHLPSYLLLAKSFTKFGWKIYKKEVIKMAIKRYFLIKRNVFKRICKFV